MPRKLKADPKKPSKGRSERKRERGMEEMKGSGERRSEPRFPDPLVTPPGADLSCGPETRPGPRSRNSPFVCPPLGLLCAPEGPPPRQK